MITTREEYERMVAAGVFRDRRVELLDGVVYEMTKGPIYAKAGIQDYWIINLSRGIL